MKKGIVLYCLFALFFAACNENAPEGGEGGTTPLQPGEITYEFKALYNRLIISGDGAMANYATPSDAPWYKYAEYVTEVIIEEGVTSVGQYAFKEYVHISKVTLPSTLKVIERSAFEGCTSLSDIDLSETAVNLIDQEAFAECKALKSVAVPASLKTIGTKAFYNCQSLATMDLSQAHLSTLGERAFYKCKALKKIDFSAASLTAIPLQAFYDCAALTEVVLPTRLQSIGRAAFDYCTALAQVHLADSKNDIVFPSQNFTTIGDWAFAECNSLTYISLSSSVKTIGEGAFYKCMALKTANLSSSNLTQLGKRAFQGCEALETVSWNSKTTTVPEKAFHKCGALKTINSFSDVKTIGTGAFAECKALDVAVPSSVVTIGDSAFFNCTALQNIKLQSDLTNLGKAAFHSCTHATLSSMKNCTKLQVIEESAFKYVGRFASTSFTIELPSTITSIKKGAFLSTGYDTRHSGHLSTVICHAKTPPTLESGGEVFSASQISEHNVYLKVPSASVETYKITSYGWRTYFSSYQIEAL
ncbi:MAG: leucine-rich repeat domain-containing protein [Paludibacteraceae bacterium]|nr:leucine-rich repeat domain-containing protein [Paludibacteraceae bacterium]